jgi:hypothetical protein
MHARYADVLDKKIKTLQSTSLYHKLRPNYDNASIMAIDDVSGFFLLQISNKNNNACDMAVKGTH